MEQMELVISQQTLALELFREPAGLDNVLKRIETEALSLVPDTSTKKGRDEIASLAYKVARSKTALDNAGKNLVADKKKELEIVDKTRRKCRDFLDALKERVREPLNSWELAEEQRKKAHAVRLGALKLLSAVHDDDGRPLTSVALQDKLFLAEATVIDAGWEEFREKAEQARAEVIAHLQNLIPIAQQREDNERELERLRFENEERLRKEGEERLRKEGEERARKALADKERDLPRSEASVELQGATRTPMMTQVASEPVPTGIVEPVPVAEKEAVLEDLMMTFQKLFALSSTKARSIVTAIDAGDIPNVKIIY